MSEPWLIAAAVDSEIRPIRSKLGGCLARPGLGGRVWEGTWKGERIVLVRTGIGPDRAGRTLKGLVLPGSVAAVCSIGYAGALKDAIRVGDLLIPAELLFLSGANPSRFEPDAFLFHHACETARKGGWRFHTERMLTSDRVVPTEREKRDLGLRWQAGSVEMESSVAARIAFEAGVPFVAVRVALDELSFSLPDVSGFLRLWKGGQWRSAAAWIVKDPSRFVGLARLWRYSRLGSIRLAAFLEGFLDRGET